MGEIPLLKELAIVATLGVVVTVLLARLRLPAVGGLLAAGAMMGPYALGLVTNVHAIEVLAEVGVVLLLFTIGLEFSFARLRDIFRQVALGGILQVGVTAALTTGIALAIGEPVGRAIFWGFAVSLSSTAIVLRMLSERQELDAPHGRFIVGTLIFQDLCVVPMVLIVPLLVPGADGGETFSLLGEALLKAVAVVALVVGLARLVAPRALGWVAASGSREVFLLAIVALCIGTAWLTSLAGLSLALGAFLGGMVVADTEYGHRAMSDILPLRDTFVSIFFVVLGMLFDWTVVYEQPMVVALLFLAFIVAKGSIATLAALAMRFPARAAWLAGVGLAQFGEFGFVLTKVAEQSGVVEASDTAPLLAAGILSMFSTPVLVRLAPHITAGERLLAPLERFFGVRALGDVDGEHDPAMRDHVVIVGFGVAGSIAARSVAACGKPLVVLDMNIENVQRGRALGIPIYYGDGTSEEALRHAGVAHARMVVILVNDPKGAERIVDTVERIAPTARVLMRTRYLRQREELFSIGAHDVVAEEVEGAVEIVSRMLRALDSPRNVIEQRIRELRDETQTTERKLTVPRRRLGDMEGLDELKIESVLVRESSAAAGESPLSMNLRQRTGALVVGVRRGGELIQSLDPTMTFAPGDVVFLVGTSEEVQSAISCFESGTTHGHPGDTEGTSAPGGQLPEEES